MPLSAGTRLGAYEILSPVGAGGMGEVYRARDTRLDRTVAIKVSNERFSDRFEREARAVAALNHPNICTLFDVGPDYLVMEFVEGPTLFEHIAAGPLPLPEVVAIARQIACALHAAHEKGIVHRDLKPANIKLTGESSVKVLDFGLAKVFDSAPGSDPANSPTLTVATRAGVVLGTAAYMAPEQARGGSVDKRADIWSFGVVLFEMLSGRRLFTGETVSDTLASVLRADIDANLLPAGTPLSIRRLLRRCLERDRNLRLHDIADARLELDDAALAETVPSASQAPQSRIAWGIAGLALIALAASIFLYLRNPAPPAPATVTLQFPLPPKTTFGGHLAVSPDGRQIAFAALGEDGRTSLWLRPFDRLEPHMLSGTENSAFYFWSPDSRSIGFWTAGKLKRIEASGGPPQTLCETPIAVGGAWTTSGFIIFGSNSRGLSRVPASGGTPVPLTQTDASQHESNHDWPVLLPDQKHLLYLTEVTTDPEQNQIVLATLDGSLQIKDRKALLPSRSGAWYVGGSNPLHGHLVFLRQNALMAQPFDLEQLRLDGDPFVVSPRVGSFLSRGFFNASAAGVLAYRGGGFGFHLEWLDRRGNRSGRFGVSNFLVDMALSNQGTRVAVSRGETFAGTDIWVLDSARDVSTRVTFQNRDQTTPIWSPDESQLAYAAGNPASIHVKAASGVGPDEEILRVEGSSLRPTDWSRDGKFLVYAADTAANRDLWVLPLQPRGKPVPVLKSPFNESQGKLSPDGRWLAYTSDESGRVEVYVQPMPLSTPAAPAGRWQISAGGGSQPRWRADGKELFYIALDRSLMASLVDTSKGFAAAAAKAVYSGLRLGTQTSSNLDSYYFAVTPDGQRFLVITADEDPPETPVTAIVNWNGNRAP